MKFLQDLIFTGVNTFTKRDTGQVFTFYRFLDLEQGNTFDVGASSDFIFPVGVETMKNVTAEFQLKINDKGKYLNLVGLKSAK